MCLYTVCRHTHARACPVSELNIEHLWQNVSITWNKRWMSNHWCKYAADADYAFHFRYFIDNNTCSLPHSERRVWSRLRFIYVQISVRLIIAEKAMRRIRWLQLLEIYQKTKNFSVGFVCYIDIQQTIRMYLPIICVQTTSNKNTSSIRPHTQFQNTRLCVMISFICSQTNENIPTRAKYIKTSVLYTVHQQNSGMSFVRTTLNDRKANVSFEK